MIPTVSVIVPVYNNSDGIQKLLNALKTQDYPQDRYEVLIVDNGSKDETLNVIQAAINELDNFQLLIEDNIRGSYAARNKGVLAANGTILAFTDSDCIPISGWISSGVKNLLKYQVSCGGGQIKYIYSKEKPNLHEKFDTLHRLNQQYYIENRRFSATANLFIYKILVIKVGMFNADLLSSGDLEFGQRVHKFRHKIIYIPDAIVKHPARKTLKANMKKSIRLAVGRKQMSMLKNNTDLTSIKFRNENKLLLNLSIIELAKVFVVDAKNYLKIIIKSIF